MEIIRMVVRRNLRIRHCALDGGSNRPCRSDAERFGCGKLPDQRRAISSSKDSLGRRWRQASIIGTAAAVLFLATAASSVASAQQGPITLSVFDSRGPLFTTIFEKTIDPAFEKAHPNIHVKWFEAGGNPAVYLSAAASGTLGCVVAANSQFAADVIKYNMFTPVDTKIITNMSDYAPVFRTELSNGQGVPLLVPYLGGGGMWFFRTDGGPSGAPQNLTTYSAFVAWAKKNTIYGSGGKVVKPGIGWYYSSLANFPTEEFTELVTAAGGKFLNYNNTVRSTKALFDSQAGLTALRFWWDTIWKYHVAWSPSQTPTNPSDPLLNFIDGREASTYFGPWLPLEMATLGNVKGLAEVRKTWDAVPLMPHPDGYGRPVSIGEVDGWGVPPSCKTPTAAWDYIKYITSEPVLLTVYKAVNHPLANTVAMQSPEAAAIRKAAMPGAVHEAEFGTSALNPYSIAEVDVPANASIYTTINTMLTSVLNNPHETTAMLRTALGSAAKQVDFELAQDPG